MTRKWRHLVLVGGGHAHVFVLKAFGENPVESLSITLVAKELAAPYSGMLPGFVAGHYPLEACQIDLVRLARYAGARLIHGSAVAIDRQNRSLQIEGQEAVAYDYLSLDTGITPDLSAIAGAAEHALAVKPVSVFAPKWQKLEARARAADGPRKFVVIGGGAAGVELITAARHRLRTLAPRNAIEADSYSFTLVAGGPVLPSHSARAQSLARAALRKTGIDVIETSLAASVAPDHVTLANGRTIPADATLISTRAAPPGWFKDTGLDLDGQGYISVRPTLQTLNDDRVFAVGDCAAMIETPREKAGVFAVRQGPVLAGNLRRRHLGEPLAPFVPQTKFLSLVSLGGKSAIASRGTFAASGRWAWTLKDRIDRKFIAVFNDLSKPKA